MKILADSADLSLIKRLFDYYPVSGVTTNPTILSKINLKPYDVLEQIRAFIGDKDLHVQVLSTKSEEMEKEALSIVNNLGKNTFIKIPVTLEGVKAIRNLSKEGVLCTGTAVYTLEQAFFASQAGAKWIAPYVNRIDSLGQNSSIIVSKMKQMIECNNFETKILGASFHYKEQITNLAVIGIDAVTVAPDFLLSILDNEVVDKAVNSFISDFCNAFGPEASMMK